MIQFNVKKLTEGKNIIDEMYKIKMEIERLGKIYEELESEKVKLPWETPTLDINVDVLNSDFLKPKPRSPIEKIYDALSEIERYVSVLQLLYITLDKLLFIQPKSLSFDPLRYRLWCKPD